MKKRILSILAIAAVAAVSCNKEIKDSTPETANPAGGTLCTIKASAAGSTKTTYADGKTFSWVAGDAIAVQYFSLEESGDGGFATFTTEDTAPVADFSGIIPDNSSMDATCYAVYPASLNPHFYTNAPQLILVDLPTSYDIRGLEDPLSILPMAAKNDGNGNYAFQHATGILKINMTGIPENAAALQLTGSAQALGGAFVINLAYFDATTADLDRMIAESYYTSGSHTVRMFFDNPDNGEATFYVPVPVGKLSAGLSIDLVDKTGTVLFSKVTTKDIEIERKQVIDLPVIDCDVWKSLGTGQYVDHFFDIPGTDVEIQQHKENPAQYRIVNPYAALFAPLDYEAPGDVYGPDSYLNFELLEQNSTYNGITVTGSGVVGFDIYYTGYFEEYYETEVLLAPGYVFSNATYDNIRFSRVLKYGSDGTPSHIQLAPAYYYDGVGAYTSDLITNNNIQIAMPGYELLDLDAYIVSAGVAPESTAEAPVIEADVYIGADLVGKVGIGTTLQDAENAATPTSGGLLKFNLPANAPTGKYYIFMITTFEGEEESWWTEYEPVTYINPADGPLTIEDVLGTYTATAYDALNDKYVTFSFTIVASDDPAFDVMITGSFGGVAFGNGYAYYGTFNADAREIVWSDNPVYYNSRNRTRTYLCIENYDAPPYTITYTVLGSGILVTDQTIVASYYNSGWQWQAYAAAWTDFSAERTSPGTTSVKKAAAPASVNAAVKADLPAKQVKARAGVRTVKRPLGGNLVKVK